MQLYDTGKPVVLGFATPIFRHRWPEAETAPVNRGLKAAILARRAQSPGAKVSNVGGWQSTTDLMSWEVAELEPLKGWINKAYGAVMGRELGTEGFQSRFSAVAWANVNESGDYNRAHTHANNHWSGVYYVDTGRPDPAIMPNGAIELFDPRPAVSVFTLPGVPDVSTWTIHPDVGTMLLFPSWLRHGVLPYFGEGPRISIAFNLRVREVSTKKPGGDGGAAAASAKPAGPA